MIACLNIAVLGVESGSEAPHYAPDRKVNITHVRIDVTPDFQEQTVAGVVTSEFAPIARPLEEMTLSAKDLHIHRVWASVAMAGWTATDEDLTVTFAPAVEPGRKVVLNVQYDAQPERGLYFRTPELGYPAEDMHLFSQGEAHEAPHWYPNYDYPNERFSSEVICRVPQDMTVVSNGRLLGEATDPNTGLKAVHWLQEKPHVNYLIALVAGRFKRIESRHKEVPLAFYTPASQIDLAARSFQGTEDMIGFFEQETGTPYPWDKYDQVAVEDFVAGGMENTSLTILTTNTLFTPETEDLDTSTMLVAHELAHQWFGDYVTCKDWAHVWLNEGFATYYENLYQGHRFGQAHFLYGMVQDSRWILANSESTRPVFDRNYESEGELFDYRAYQKGGWVVHMLRARLGDGVFRRCVQTYLQRYGLGTVTTEDLRAVAEEVSGQSLDRFFDQWIFRGGLPRLKVAYSWSDKTRLARISVQQTQAQDGTGVFHLPTQVRFVVAGERIDRDLTIEQAKQDFYFPLAAEPNMVRFDPQYTVLAEVTFDLPKAMLYEQLARGSDVVGQVLAAKALSKDTDKKTVGHLKEALNGAAFYGVRCEAAQALREIRTDEALDALAQSLHQPDAWVRDAVVDALGGFYGPQAMAALKTVVEQEKNPGIVATALRGLGIYADPEVHALIRRNLDSQSFRNRLVDAAVIAIRRLGDPAFVPDLERLIDQRQDQLTTGGLCNALDCLASISQDLQDKAEVRDLLTGFVTHKRRAVQMAAIRALGTLRDPRAIGVLETYAGSGDRGDRLSEAAEHAIEALRKEKPIVANEVVELRKAVDDLKKDNKKLQDQVEGLEKQVEALRGTQPGDPNDRP
ncbi:MAG: HEAT repeat domain-containing protein [Phycisphaerae bacterium]|nr:HEAT repeat domain-containing protein [Phycisphaerae bacterium]